MKIFENLNDGTLLTGEELRESFELDKVEGVYADDDISFEDYLKDNHYEEVFLSGEEIENLLTETQNQITFDTYPPVYWDYDKGIENHDYDETITMFTVPYSWYLEWLENSDDKMTDEEFMDNYDWDWTEAMEIDASAEGKIIDEWISYRDGRPYVKPIGAHAPTGKEVALSLDSWEAEWLYNMLNDHAAKCSDEQDAETARSIYGQIENIYPDVRTW